MEIKIEKTGKEKPTQTKNQIKQIKVWQLISKTSIYFLVFFLPIFFLPWTAEVLDFNKQTLLLFLVFISLISWFLQFLAEGKVRVNFSPFNLLIIVFLAVLAVSTGFSFYRYGSFWGWPLNIASSFLTVLGLAILYFLIINLFRKNELVWLFFTLGFSSFLAVLFGTFQLLGKFIFPLDFTRFTSFNSVGTINSLAIFSAAFLPLLCSLIFLSKRVAKILFAVFSLAALVLIFLVNFWLAWLLVLVGAVTLLIFGMIKRESFNFSWLVLLMFVLITALFFGILRIPSPVSLATPIEISLTQGTTIEITKQALMERFPISLLLGSGPSTFVFNYSKFKPAIINQSDFWEIRFSSGASEILDRLATTGVLGIISFLLIMVSVIGISLKFLLKKSAQPENEKEWLLGLGIFSAWLSTAFSLFFYPANLSIGFLFWIFTAGLILISSSRIKEREFGHYSISSIGLAFLFIFVLIFGIGVLFMGGQRYLAEVRYRQALGFFQQGKNDQAINQLQSSLSLTRGAQDNYWRDVAQIYLFAIREELQKKDIPQEELFQKIRLLVANAINSAKTATEVSSHNVANWTTRGFVYQNLINLVDGAEEWAIKSYQEATKLESTNPYIYTEIGRIYLAQEELEKAREQFQKAIDLKGDYAPAHFQMAMVWVAEGKVAEAIEKLEEIKQIAPLDAGLAFQLGLLYYNDNKLDKAKEEFERATNLDPNYSNARYFLGLVHDKKGRKNLAIEQFEKVSQLNPENEEVKKILVNLREGKPALEGIVPAQPPVEEDVPPERLTP